MPIVAAHGIFNMELNHTCLSARTRQSLSFIKFFSVCLTAAPLRHTAPHSLSYPFIGGLWDTRIERTQLPTSNIKTMLFESQPKLREEKEPAGSGNNRYVHIALCSHWLDLIRGRNS